MDYRPLRDIIGGREALLFVSTVPLGNSVKGQVCSRKSRSMHVCIIFRTNRTDFVIQ